MTNNFLVFQQNEWRTYFLMLVIVLSITLWHVLNGNRSKVQHLIKHRVQSPVQGYKSTICSLA